MEIVSESWPSCTTPLLLLCKATSDVRLWAQDHILQGLMKTNISKRNVYNPRAFEQVAHRNTKSSQLPTPSNPNSPSRMAPSFASMSTQLYSTSSRGEPPWAHRPTEAKPGGGCKAQPACLTVDIYRKTCKRVMGPLGDILQRNMEQFMKFQAANIEGGLWWDGMDGRRGNRSLRIGDWEIGEWGKGGAITNCKKNRRNLFRLSN